MSAAKWYLHTGSEQSGPFSAEDVKARRTSGQVKGPIYAWSAGMSGWVPVEQVAELAAAEAEPPSPPPPPMVLKMEPVRGPAPAAAPKAEGPPPARPGRRDPELSTLIELNPKGFDDQTGLIDHDQQRRAAAEARRVQVREIKSVVGAQVGAPEGRKRLLMLALGLVAVLALGGVLFKLLAG